MTATETSLRPPIARAYGRLVGPTAVVVLAAGALAATGEPRMVAAAAAMAVGWSHLAGRCGLSHFGTLTPRGKLSGLGRRAGWLVDVITYVVAGAVAAAAVGAVLGIAGGPLGPGAAGALVLAVALVAGAGELGLLRWRLPEPGRQTRQEWGYVYRSPVAAAMWGFSLGLTVATVFTFSGVWVVLALAVAGGDPAFGATLLVVHWLARALPIVVGPLLLSSPAGMSDLLDAIERRRPLFQATNLAGIGLAAIAAVLVLAERTGL